MTESPADLPGLQPDEFVGASPTGEDDAGAFTSGDQSTGEPDDDETDDDETGTTVETSGDDA